MNEKLSAIARRVESDRLHFAAGNAIQLDDSKDREYLLSLVLRQHAALKAVASLVDKASDGYTYTLPGGYPSRPVEATDLRKAIAEALGKA